MEHQDYAVARDLCSEGLSSEFRCYAERVKAKIASLPTSSKQWWKMCNSLMLKKSFNTNIPPLRDENGIWAFSVAEKPELVSKVFQDKFQVPPNPDAIRTGTEKFDTQSLDHGCLLVRSRWARK